MFIVLEYLPKGNLFDHMKLRVLDDNQVAKIFRDVMLAVHFLHSRSIFHRDIKPENVLLDGNGNFKLCDFGFSALFGNGERRQTLCGTKEYLAPEVISSEAQDDKVDIWCMGVLLFELIHKRPPYSCKNIIQLYNEIKVKKLSFRSNINPDFRRIIEMCLKLEPEDRPTAKQIVDMFPWLRDDSIDYGSPKPISKNRLPQQVRETSNYTINSSNQNHGITTTQKGNYSNANVINVYSNTNGYQTVSDRNLIANEQTSNPRIQRMDNQGKFSVERPKEANFARHFEPSHTITQFSNKIESHGSSPTLSSAGPTTNVFLQTLQFPIEPQRSAASLVEHFRPNELWRTEQPSSNNAKGVSWHNAQQTWGSQKHVVLDQSPIRNVEQKTDNKQLPRNNFPQNLSSSPAPRMNENQNEPTPRYYMSPVEISSHASSTPKDNHNNRVDSTLLRTMPVPTNATRFTSDRNVEITRAAQTTSNWTNAPFAPHSEMQVFNIYRKEANENLVHQPNIYKTLSPDPTQREFHRFADNNQRPANVPQYQITSNQVKQPVVVQYTRTQSIQSKPAFYDSKNTQQTVVLGRPEDRKNHFSSSVPRRVDSYQHPLLTQGRVSDHQMPVQTIVRQQPQAIPQYAQVVQVSQVSRGREQRSTSAQISHVRSVRYTGYN